jgi:organic hydroperoxide reductase OsmC/OhrA
MSEKQRSTYQVGVIWDKQNGCEAQIRNLPSISIDMPVKHGGRGISYCPHEILFSAVGSCFLGTFIVFQRQLRLKLIDLQVSVEGAVELANQGKDDGKYEITGIDVHVKAVVEGAQFEKDIVDDCVRMTKEHCPTIRALQGSVFIRIVSEIAMVSE